MSMNSLYWHEKSKAWEAIYNLHQARFRLQKFPNTPKLQAKIKELKSLEDALKKAAKDPAFLENLLRGTLIKNAKGAEAYGEGQRLKREQRRSWNGKTREQLSERNQKIVESYQKNRKSHLTMAGFAIRNAAKYGLKPRTLRFILTKAVGNLPG